MPMVDVYGEQLFVMTRTAHLEDDHIAYGETAIFVGKNFVISVRHGSAQAHSDLRAQLEAAPSLLGQGPDYVLHAILDFIVDGFLPIVETIEERVLASYVTDVAWGSTHVVLKDLGSAAETLRYLTHVGWTAGVGIEVAVGGTTAHHHFVVDE